MKNNSRFWIRAAACVAGGFHLINSFAVRAQTADSFDPQISYILPGPVYTPVHIRGLAVQPDGRFLVGGTFNNINGVPQFDLARFQPDGALETAFKPSTTGPANSVGVLRDGGILASEFVRYLPDGATDPSFSLEPGSINGRVFTSLIKPDGSLILAVEAGLDTVLKRLNPDGSLDESFLVFFTPHFGAQVSSLALQRDGRILVGGAFESVNGVSRVSLARLHPDGSLDESFDPNPNNSGGIISWIDSMAVQGDGKILVAGSFEVIGGRTNNAIARLNPDGTADSGFTSPFVDPCCGNPWGYSIALQTDGKIIVGGNINPSNFQYGPYLARFNPNGSLDTSFNAAPVGNDLGITALALDASGRLLVSGYFTQVGGQARTGMARLINLGPATESLSYQGSTVTWLRGGTAPDVWTTTFELSTNGSSWTSLGEGSPVAGGWQLTGVSAPLGSRIRARGFIASGYANASQGIVESVSTVSLRILSGNLAQQPFGFTLAGPANQSVVIEGSTNLQNWIPLQTNLVPANGLLPFTDPDPVTRAQRFYRGRAE